MKKILGLALSILFLASCGNNADFPVNSNAEPIDESFDFTIVSSNDIHGQIDPENQYVNGSGRAGVVKYFSYAKHIKDTEENVFLFDQGDTFQGNIYSNTTRGFLITDLMNYLKYDAKCLGNHDFDWGLEPIKDNKARDYEGYTTPTLCANVYDYNFKTKKAGTTHQDDLGDYSIIKTLSNGFKLGVIGSIGSNQITSITSNLVKDITFTDHIEAIKKEATKLKDAGCHFIVDLHHGTAEELLNHGLSEYINLALCGHTHRYEKYNEGSTRYYQFKAYTEALGKLVYHFDKNTQKISLKNDRYISSRDMWTGVVDDDPVIMGIVNDYKDQVESKVNPNQVVANNVNGVFESNHQVPNLMAKAMYDTALKEGYNVDFSYVNQLRHDLYNTTLTYKDIYEAAPFDNTVYIYDVTYEEVVNQIKSRYFICKEENKIINLRPGETYKVAIIDYCLFHVNTNRYFDQFPSMNTNFYKDDLEIPSLSMKYREILKEWLIDNGYSNGKLLDSSDFRSSQSMFNKDELVLE